LFKLLLQWANQNLHIIPYTKHKTRINNEPTMMLTLALRSAAFAILLILFFIEISFA